MKYLANGQEVEVVEQLKDGFLVRPILTDGHEEYAGNPEIVHRLFDKPPVAKLGEEVARLTSELQEKQGELNTVTREIETATQERKRLIASLSQVPALQHIEDFISGNITHYVLISKYEPDLEILPIDATTLYDGWSDKFKLLTLFGSSDGSLTWEINQYTDGSGATQTVIPARSQEEAEELARKYVLQFIADNKYADWNKVLQARKIGLTIPSEYVEAARQNKAKRVKKNVAYQKGELAKAEAELAKILEEQ